MYVVFSFPSANCNYVKHPWLFHLAVDKSDGTDSESGAQEEDIIPDEIYKSRLASIKRVCPSLCIISISYFFYVDYFLVSYDTSIDSTVQEEEVVLRERERYELEKGQLIKEMKRIRDEDGSRFNHFPVLNCRYALLNLLGKGGFSEVYKVRTLIDTIVFTCERYLQ